ncbi:MAG: ATP-dependent RNA helicase HrpA [Ilumatobacteraceae bacterium]
MTTAPELRVAIPDDLPIAAHADDLVAALRDHRVVVVAGETGSGKSTQLPKLCLAAGRGVNGMIGHTQPRRVAARSIASRVASELSVELGAEVGFSVRFDDRVADTTRIRLMTDGILLAELQRDPELRRYDTLIIDEAHERSLNVDFLLGYLRRLLDRRDDLHLVITSATIDTERFARHFASADGTPAPVHLVEGRGHPVEIRYRPPEDDVDQVSAIIDAVNELDPRSRTGVDGDVLVFLSGEREIHDTARAIRDLALPRVEVLPLYARLSAAEQQRVFAPHPGRRIVLATNVAETSITVPGVRAVIDTGTARISRYSRRSKVQRLPIEPVSQASAAQRAGRCGRVAPGVCIRLYSEEDLASRPEFTEPEILRTSLASVILQMASLGLGRVDDFPFVEAPDPSQVTDGRRLLLELGALKADDGSGRDRLTRLGRRLARLPVDPRVGRMIIESDRHGCVREVLVIAAALSIQDVRERPREHRDRADALHRRFEVPGSDLLSIVALWDYLRERQAELSGNAFRRMCVDEHLNYIRVREWRDLYSQLRRVAGEVGIRPGADSGHPDRVHQAVLSGLLSQIGMRDRDRRDYLGARGTRFTVAPGSVLTRAGAPWVMAAELVETDRLRARRVAEIKPEWVEHAAGPLARRSYGDPEWDARSGRAVISERVTVHGLPVVDGRRIGLDRVDAEQARRLLILHGLVRGEWGARLSFLDRNARLVERIRVVEDRLRRRDLVDEHLLCAHYDRALPTDIVSGRHLERWWRSVVDDDPARLDLDRDPTVSELLAQADSGLPEVWREGGHEYVLTYRHDPGSVFDGVTVHIPLTAINRFSGVGLDWQVAGHRAELADELTRSLPKESRRRLIPVAATVTAALDLLPTEPDERAFTEALAEALSKVSGTSIAPGDLDPSRLPIHLRIHVVVSDDDGEVHAFGDDVGAVLDLARPGARAAIASRAPIEERTGIVDWDVGDLPEVVEWGDGDETIRAHPTLLDRGSSVSLRLVTDRALAERLLHEGVRRLVLLTAPPSRAGVRDLLTGSATLDLPMVGLGPAALLDDCLGAVVDRLIDDVGVPRDRVAFELLQTASRSTGGPLLLDVVHTALAISADAAAVLRRLERLRAPAAGANVADIEAHLDRLLGPGFVSRAGTRRLPDLRRYLAGIAHRVDHLGGRLDRDRRAMDEIAPAEARVRAALTAHRAGAEPPAVREAVWMLEELRVATFAQPVGARGGPTLKRLLSLLD